MYMYIIYQSQEERHKVLNRVVLADVRWHTHDHRSKRGAHVLVQMCDMTHSYVWHDSCICVTSVIECVTWLTHVCDTPDSSVWHASSICDMPHLSVTWLVRMCDMHHSYVRHDSFIRVTWLIHMCDMTHSYVRHDSFMCDMHHSYAWHSCWHAATCPSSLRQAWRAHVGTHEWHSQKSTP